MTTPEQDWADLAAVEMLPCPNVGHYCTYGKHVAGCAVNRRKVVAAALRTAKQEEQQRIVNILVCMRDGSMWNADGYNGALTNTLVLITTNSKPCEPEKIITSMTDVENDLLDAMLADAEQQGYTRGIETTSITAKQEGYGEGIEDAARFVESVKGGASTFGKHLGIPIRALTKKDQTK